MKETFYVTTPIYYPNDVPHLGHAYTTIAADALARWHQLLGEKTFLLTGTDEHTKKVLKAAEKAGKKPQEFTDALIPHFKEAWKSLNIKYDRFIRTSDSDHKKIVQEFLEKVNKNKDIYLGKYSGLYCDECEAYYTENDPTIKDLNCQIHDKPLQKLEEDSYFFKLSKYQKFLLDLYKKNPDFISPKHRRKEIINRVKAGLHDLSISRKDLAWGIQLPFDKTHVAYVWFDALINYYTAASMYKLGVPDVHIIGKDILWFHSVYWPAMLKSAGLPLPKKVFAHGWWTVKSKKMGKSAGNAVKINDLVKIAGPDSARYFLLRETPFGDDGDFSQEALIERHNNELANKLGNLISRTTALAEKYGLQSCKPIPSKALQKQVKDHLNSLAFDKAIYSIIHFIDTCNEYIQKKKPWETKDKKVLYQLANAIKDVSILLWPFIPETSEKIAENLGFKISLKALESPLKVKKIKKSPILFKKI